MFFTHKNYPIKLNGEFLFASQIDLSADSNLGALYLDGQRHSFSTYPIGPVNGSCRISYFLTGTDIVKAHLQDDEVSISGNIGGIYFNSGYVKSYSATIQPNSPIQVNAELVFFESLMGQFLPEKIFNPNPNYLNGSDVVVTNSNTNIDIGSITSSSYNYNSEITPVFHQTTGTGFVNISPNRVVMGKKQVTMEFSSDTSGMNIPIEGLNAAIRIQAADSQGVILETFSVDGTLNKKTLNISTSSPTLQKFEITQNRIADNPTVTSFSPAMPSLGDTISIYGTNFRNVLNVYVNEEAADYFNVISDTRIDAKIGSALNSGFIRVDTFEDGATSSSQIPINYGTITVNSFDPLKVISGKNVTINGSNFYKISNVLFNNTPAESFNVINGQYINAIAPGRILNGPISVISNSRYLSGISSSNFSAFPVIDSFTPKTGVPNTLITLSGANLVDLSTVKINGINASFSQINSNSTQITVPVGNTWGYISVTNNQNQRTISKYGFSPEISITGLSLVSGKANSSIIISGINFNDYMMYDLEGGGGGSSMYKVSFNGQYTGFLRIDAQTLQGVVPRGAKTGPVYIYKPDGASTYDSTGSFIYIQDEPILNSFSPATISSGDSLKALIVGENLNNINKVYLVGSGNALGNTITIWDKTYNVNNKPANTTGNFYCISSGQNDLLGLAATFQHTLRQPSSFTGNMMLTGLAVKTGVYDLYVENVAGVDILSGATVIYEPVDLARLHSTRITQTSTWPSGDTVTYGPEKVVDGNTGTYCRTDTLTGQWLKFNFSSACQIFKINFTTFSTGYTLGTTGYLEVSLLTGSGISTGIASSGMVNINPYTTYSSGYGINTGTMSWRNEANSVLFRVNRRNESGFDIPYPLLLSNVEIYGVKMSRAQ